MVKKYSYFNRDLSWLSFNYRVLEVAKDPSLPLYERIKFLAIYSSNLDEFYKVRVASYRNSTDDEELKLKKDEATAILKSINQEVGNQLNEFGRIFNKEILPELESNGIFLLRTKPTDPEHCKFAEKYFYQDVLPYIQPVLLAEGKILTFLQDNVIYLIVKLLAKSKKQNTSARKKVSYALIKVPTNYLPRFVQLPSIDNQHFVLFLDDIIRYNLAIVFPGYDIDACYSVKLSRDADLMIEDEKDGDLIEKIKHSLYKRKIGIPSRFLYDSRMPNKTLKTLRKIFNLAHEDLVVGAKYHNFSDFFNFPNPLSPLLELAPQRPLRKLDLDQFGSLFKSIQIRDRFLFFPYHTYDYVLKFLYEASTDPDVEEIKITQYRLAKNSLIVNSLITAAQNGKKVTVFVEIKARFEEEMNLYYCNEMQRAGIKVISSIPGLKVHAKIALVLKKTQTPSEQRGYVFLCTGNFNEKTALIYADTGIFTAKNEIVSEVENLFRYLESQEHEFDFKYLLVGQFNMRKKLKDCILREIKNVERGGVGHIILKMNSLEDKKMINLLYEASEKGVKINLIIRGICCLVPDQTYSKNISIRRIVDRYLEHSRAFVFYNNGANDTYISSADMMKRNLYNRVETTVPIFDPDIKKIIYDLLEIQLNDNTSASRIDDSMTNIPLLPIGNEPLIRSQYAIYDYLKSKE